MLDVLAYCVEGLMSLGLTNLIIILILMLLGTFSIIALGVRAEKGGVL